MDDAVIGIVVTSDKKIVLTKRSDTPIWVLPGGGIDNGETPEMAILRELKEETGLDVSIKYKCAEYQPANSLTATTHVFECSVADGHLQLSDETVDIGSFDPAMLPSPFFMLHKAWLKDWQEAQGKLVCKKITEINYFAILKFFLAHPLILLKFVYNKYLKKL